MADSGVKEGMIGFSGEFDNSSPGCAVTTFIVLFLLVPLVSVCSTGLSH